MGILSQLGDLGSLSAGALVAMFVVAILWGYLVPRKMYRELMADRDYWRTAAELHQARADKTAARADKFAEQIDKLIEGSETTSAMIRAIQTPQEVKGK